MFSYNTENIILNKCNVEFKEGTINAIVGQSGSGKSTLFNLLVVSLLYQTYSY